MSNVVSPWGYSIPEKAVQSDLVAELEDMLEKAKSGELVGMVVAVGYHDGYAGWAMRGMVGSYAMVGALALAQRNHEEHASR